MNDEVFQSVTGDESLRALAPFDSDFYVRCYPDINPSKIDPQRHFIEHGLGEERFGTQTALDEAVEIVEKSGRFDAAWYYKEHKVRKDPIVHYLLSQTSSHYTPNAAFKRDFFANYYKHTLKPHEVPFVGFCRLSTRRWCFETADRIRSDSEEVAASAFFDDDYFRRQCGDLSDDMDAATYYVTEGFRRLLSPSKAFNTRAYLAAYSDIAASELCPLVHFIRHGRAEGRRSFGTEARSVVTGFSELNVEKETILIVSHEASLSGAPIVGLNLARHFKKTHNVVSVVLRSGPLTEEFAKVSHEVVVAGDCAGSIASAVDYLTGTFDIAYAVLNSIECTKMLPMLVERRIPAVSLLHEFAQYVWPFNMFARALALSDVAVFPAELVKFHAQRELRSLGVPDQPLGNVRIRPQGRPVVPVIKAKHRLDPEIAAKRLARHIKLRSGKGRPLVVLGAGWVQPRKGVDLFIETARILTKDLSLNALFVWVGPNYEPRRDTTLSVYLADQIAKSGLEDTIVFFDEQPDLQPFYEQADAFLLSSRLDPYPNVAVEAISEGLPVVCFEGATGIAELAHLTSLVTAVPYNDNRAAAIALKALVPTSGERPQRRRDPPEALRTMLSFDAYARDVATALEEARARRQRRGELADELLRNGNFDPLLFKRSLPMWLTFDEITAIGRESLAEFASVLAMNDMPIALSRDNRSTAAAAQGWHEANMLTLDIEASAPSHPLECGALIVFAEKDETSAELIASLCFSKPSLRRLVIVSESLTRSDLFAVERVVGDVVFTIVDRQDAVALQADMAALYASLDANVLVEVVFDLSLYERENARPLSAVATACDGDAPASTFLLSSLVAKANADFLVDDGRTAPSPFIKGFPLAQRLIDCRGVWFRPTAADRQQGFIDAVAASPSPIRSRHVWDALSAPGGLLEAGGLAVIQRRSPLVDGGDRMFGMS